MQKKSNFRGFWIIIALAAVIGFMAGCDNPANTGGGPGDGPGGVPSGPTTITYTATQDGGTNGTVTSTGIVFTFSASVGSLNVADITVGGAASIGSATVSGSGTNWTLSPITVNAAGTATVSINKTGIEATAKSVIVFKAGGYVPEYWTINWNLNGGAFVSGSNHPDQIVKGTVLAKPSPDPTKAGNTFGGWYTDYALTQAYTFANAVNGNLNLYAKWVAGSQPTFWSITWNLNGGTQGTGTYPDQIARGTILAKPSPNPTKDNNDFGGWYADSSLTQKYNFAYAVTANLNLYAKWETPLPPPTGTAVSGNTLAEKLQWVKDNAVSNTTYTIEVSADEAIDPHTLSYTSLNDITIILWGSEGEKVISLSQRGPLFTVETDVTLVLYSNITLQGRSDNYSPLVIVDGGGTLIMNTRAKISGNTYRFSSSNTDHFGYGGGVVVAENGVFTMKGGEISGNTITPPPNYYNGTYGGGVFVGRNGIFTMEDGEISYNSAITGGGGVYVGNNATFTMEGGKISNNTADRANVPSGGGVYVGNNGGGAGTFTMRGGEISGNTSGSGGGVYVNYYSTFTMEDGEISGNTASSGGGVYTSTGSFTMTGGKISGNTARSGGGVYVGNNVTFIKSGGTIYGYDASDMINSNVVKNSSGVVVSDQGHAVYVYYGSMYKRRETTAGPAVNLDSTKDGAEGGWEN